MVRDGERRPAKAREGGHLRAEQRVCREQVRAQRQPEQRAVERPARRRRVPEHGERRKLVGEAAREVGGHQRVGTADGGARRRGPASSLDAAAAHARAAAVAGGSAAAPAALWRLGDGGGEVLARGVE